jgi:hypothetical protein
MKLQYWATGDNFDYDIVIMQPHRALCGSIAGPFETLGEAKEQVRDWIKSDRDYLTHQLDKINAFRRASFNNY